MVRTQREVSIALLVLAIALLFVGVVSGTVLRHVVQIIPTIIALIVVARTPRWGAYAAMPIFGFWLFIVTLIWLFLLGLSRIASGRYTVAEVVATLVMAGASAAGLIRSVRLGRELPVRARILALATFAAFQIVAMWISLSPAIANR